MVGDMNNKNGVLEVRKEKEAHSFKEIKESFNPFSLHAGPRMLIFMYIDDQYHERKRNEYVLSRLCDHKGTSDSLYHEYHHSQQAEHDTKPLEAFQCWACGVSNGSMIMVTVTQFICPDCHGSLTKLFPQVHKE